MTIDRFDGEFRFLSNFFPCQVELGGLIYPTVEHAYQAAKSIDPGVRRKIQSAPRPGIAKSLGRQIVLRDDWNNETKLLVMEQLLHQKFSKDPFRRELLSTGSESLREGNDWGDSFWGVFKGQGQNHLGRLLMAIRSKLQKEEDEKKKLQREEEEKKKIPSIVHNEGGITLNPRLLDEPPSDFPDTPPENREVLP